VAEAIWARRADARSTADALVYVGTLTYLANASALTAFMNDVWPDLVKAVPGLKLTVIGKCPPPLGRSLSAHQGVEVIGFQEDLTSALANAAAVILPYRAEAGSSLRTLFYALGGVPIVGSPAAFRGIPFDAGLVADTPEQWLAAVESCLQGGLATDRARAAALHLQKDRKPWDVLYETIRQRVRAA
jgi:glycosyltransferase involved in cell wall biosynthesis